MSITSDAASETTCVTFMTVGALRTAGTALDAMTVPASRNSTAVYAPAATEVAGMNPARPEMRYRPAFVIVMLFDAVLTVGASEPPVAMIESEKSTTVELLFVIVCAPVATERTMPATGHAASFAIVIALDAIPAATMVPQPI